MDVNTYNTLTLVFGAISILCVIIQVFLLLSDAKTRAQERAEQKKAAIEQEALRSEEWEQRKREYLVPLDLSLISRAADLTEYYRKEIISLTYFINVCFSFLEIDVLLKDLPFEKMKCFNTRELTTEIMVDGIADAHRNMVVKADPAIVAFCKYYAFRDFNSLREYSILTRKSDEESGVAPLPPHRSELIHAISMALNKMEYFAMNFRSGIADESVAYPPLHETFLSDVHSLYYWISQHNTGRNSCKYYTNLIWLHNLWTEEKKKMMSQEDAVQQQADCNRQVLEERKKAIEEERKVLEEAKRALDFQIEEAGYRNPKELSK